MTKSVRVWSRLCFKGDRGAADNQHRRRGTPQAYSCEPHVLHGIVVRTWTGPDLDRGPGPEVRKVRDLAAGPGPAATFLRC